MTEVIWQRDLEFIGANRAERALIGDYELVVFDLPAIAPAPPSSAGNCSDRPATRS